MIIDLITCLIYLVGSAYLAEAALKKYVAHSLNYENVLYWGLSFVMIGLSAIMHIILIFSQNPSINQLLVQATYTLENMAIWLNLYAMAYVANACPYYNTKKCVHHKACKRKVVRISVWTVMIASMLFITLTSLVFNPVMVSAVYQLLMIAVIAVSLYKYRKFKIYLYMAYMLYGTSRLANIAYALSPSPYIEQISLGLAAGAMIVMMSEVLKIINREED